MGLKQSANRIIKKNKKLSYPPPNQPHYWDRWVTEGVGLTTGTVSTTHLAATVVSSDIDDKVGLGWLHHHSEWVCKTGTKTLIPSESFTLFASAKQD